MARTKCRGKVETFSVSVSAETKARVRKAAERAYGGNVSCWPRSKRRAKPTSA